MYMVLKDFEDCCTIKILFCAPEASVITPPPSARCKDVTRQGWLIKISEGPEAYEYGVLYRILLLTSSR